MAGPWGFEPQSSASKAERIIQATLRARRAPYKGCANNTIGGRGVRAIIFPIVQHTLNVFNMAWHEQLVAIATASPSTIPLNKFCMATRSFPSITP